MNTAGFISGYRGSPLGMVDQQLWKAKKLLERATCASCPRSTKNSAAPPCSARSAWKSDPERTRRRRVRDVVRQGPVAWTARATRCKHGNAHGLPPHGGVLVVAGDDHGCVSSSMPHQSDFRR